jgi:pimeloyl-ACP methyl ester carboxylesterase
VGNLCHEWFYETLQGVSPQIAPPRLFTPYELKRIKTPVLLILGSDDKIAGNPEKVINRAVNLPEVQIRVLESAHLVNVEKSGEVNQLINKFLKN